MSSGPVVVLAGGTGGARLARGMLDVVGDDLVVIANTADDIVCYGAHVSPDPDLCAFWLADRVDDRGWGLRDDTFTAMDGFRELGVDVWFSLGDRDLAYGLHRAGQLSRGARLTEVHLELCRALGLRARVLPMTDDPVRTSVKTTETWMDLQRFLILHGTDAVHGVRFAGAADAEPSREVLDAIAKARVVVIGPSNPVISIGPMLALPGFVDALRATAAPVVGVSPIVGGRVLKGPTAAFLRHAGVPCSAAGVVELYGDLLDGVVTDEPIAGTLRSLVTDTKLDTPQARRAVAQATLDFAMEAA